MKNKIKNVNVAELIETYRRVLYYFFGFPDDSIGLNDLSESVSMSKTSTRLAVNHLTKEGFLKIEEIGKSLRISVTDRADPYFIIKKIPYNLQLVYESGILGAVYDKVPNAKAIILFGSYRWGTDSKISDIDIAVEITGEEEMKIDKIGVIQELGFRKNVQVNLHIFSRKKIDKRLFSNIANGIILEGFLEVSL